MTKLQRASAVFLALLLALVQPRAALAASEASHALALAPLAMTHQSGAAQGRLTSLAVRDQGWEDDDPAKYVRFTTPDVCYTGYRTYQLPSGVTPASVTALRVEANYFGSSKNVQTWTWALYNWRTNAWIAIGDNKKTPAREWNVLIFNVSASTSFISATGKIRLRLVSNNPYNDARLDYEAIHILYTPATPPAPASGDIPNPPAGKLYHGVYPGGVTGEEDDLALVDVLAYQHAAGKHAGWVYFSHNWYNGRAFPTATAEWIRAAGSVPYIRLMLRSDPAGGRADPVYSLTRILNGAFDNDLRAWCAGARDFRTPLIAEYGVEVNGKWFPWNGKWNGAGTLTGYGNPNQPDGPERFRDAYRRIIQTCRDEGADNITWVFHVNDGDWPQVSWNRLENYYPGDAYIDWLAISSYGAQTPLDTEWPIFRESMDEVYPRVAALSADKPIIVAEFGVTANSLLGSQSDWARNALADLTGFRWPRIIAFSWWNEWWRNDNKPYHDTNMRVQDNPLLAQVFQNLVGDNPIVLGRIP